MTALPGGRVAPALAAALRGGVQPQVHTPARVRLPGAAETGTGPRPCGCPADVLVFGHRPACEHGGSRQTPPWPSGAVPGLAR